jgi:threonine aldolase
MSDQVSFLNDYNMVAHPDIIKAVSDASERRYDGYGTDEETSLAIDAIRDHIGVSDADVHLLSGGTQANLVAASAFLRPYEAVVAAETAHIYTHETGAIEATGHKVLPRKTKDGKLRPDDIENEVRAHTDEHMVKPAMAYISQATEYGTVYSKDELLAIRDVCTKHGMILYVDGARLGYAITSDNPYPFTMNDIAGVADAFYIGGTKQGLLFGEALVICNPALTKDVRYILKQNGALLAKGFLLGIQFRAIFQNGLYYTLSERANFMAKKIRAGIMESGYDFEIDSVANQVFPILDNAAIAELEKDFLFEKWNEVSEYQSSIRLTTTWATSDDDVDALLNALARLAE